MLSLLILAITAAQALTLPSSDAAAAKRGRVYRVPGGGKLVVPDSSVTRGSRIVIRRAKGPAVPTGRGTFGAPVSLRVKRGRLVGPVRLMLPLRGTSIETYGMPLDLSVQLAYFDAKAGLWRVVPARINRQHTMIIARIRHFSWWNPLTWDWAGLALRLDQRVGELRGARTGPAHCTSGVGTPGWADVTTNNGSDLPLRTCSEGQDDKVVVQIVNNRPYGVILRYGAPVAFGWHEHPGDAAGEIAMQFADQLVSRNELYIAPLKAASVGVPKGTWFNGLFQASVTPKSIAADILTLALDKLDTKGIRPQLVGRLATACSGTLKPGLDGSIVIDTEPLAWVATIGECLLKALPQAAKDGLLDGAALDQLEHAVTLLARVQTAAEAASLAGRLADYYVGTRSDLQALATFNIRRRADQSPTTPIPTPAASPTVQPTPGASPTAQPTTAPQPTTRQITVDNRVTNGATQMREDTPAYLSTVTHNYCKRDGCALSGTDVGSGNTLTAECTLAGDRTTNGQDNSSIDDSNPGLYSSTRWYGIRWGDGRFGYISEVWIASQFRGGLSLRVC